MTSSSRLGRVGLIVALVALASACSDRGARVPTQPAMPALVSDSPQATLHLVEWSWNQRDLGRYSDLLAEDFVFQCGPLDPYGSAYRDSPWTREDELISVGRLFDASISLTLTLDRNLRVVSDPRPGKNPRWHRVIPSSLFLQTLIAEQRTDVTGFAMFFFVRGDSALIPRALIDRGVTPDSTRWFLERWEDESASMPGTRALPSRNVTLCQVKALNR